MKDISISNQRQSIKTMSIAKLILLDIVTFGLYPVYWYLNRTASLLQSHDADKKITPALYFLAAGLVAWKILSAFVLKSFHTSNWLILSSCLSGLVNATWTIWISRMVSERWKVKLSPNRVLSVIHLITFNHYYLQHKLNCLAVSKEHRAVVSSDKWLNRIVPPFWVLLSAFIFIRIFIVNLHSVPTVSMSPTVIVGDTVLSSRIAFWGIDDVQPGDLIVFSHPENPTLSYIKRVVGKPGDKIRIDDNLVYINDVPQKKLEINSDENIPGLKHLNSEDILFEEAIGNNSHLILEQPARSVSSLRSFPSSDEKNYTVPPDSLFVLGDNRDNSADSRTWGHLPFKNVKGKVQMVVWSRNSHKGGDGSLRDDRFLLKIN